MKNLIIREGNYAAGNIDPLPGQSGNGKEFTDANDFAERAGNKECKDVMHVYYAIRFFPRDLFFSVQYWSQAALPL